VPSAVGLLTAAGLSAEDLATHLSRAKVKGEAGDAIAIPVLGHGGLVQVLALGVGDAGPVALRKAGATAARRLAGHGSGYASVLPEGVAPAAVRAFVEGFSLAAYAFGRKAVDAKRLRLDLQVPAAGGPDAVERALVVARAVHLARDLTNEPSSTKDPQWLVEKATAAAESGGVAVRVLDETQLAAQGFGGIVAVGMGSVRPPRLVELTYTPPGATRSTPHVVLVGKGITFDTGGISIKSNDGMIAMKTDMAGAAVVAAVLSSLAELKVGVRVTGLLACAENMPSGTAQRPSDVITHYGGRTVEVLNTDAEGRLVLADALAYADAKLAPDAMVDLATLTGAVGVALGRRDAALFASDQQLGAALETASAASGERLWQLPFVEDYRPALDSPVADLANVARPGNKTGGGTILAAMFLREFTGGRAWAHIDMANTSRSDSDSDEISRGATGYGVRLLLHWLETGDVPTTR
jgi:leucyl aminopeptidase